MQLDAYLAFGGGPSANRMPIFQPPDATLTSSGCQIDIWMGSERRKITLIKPLLTVQRVLTKWSTEG